MYRLVATDMQSEWTYPLPETEARLGSQSDNDIVIPSRGVSRHHALVRRVPGGVEILNQKSRNGVRVGGRRVERALLTPGLRVQMGGAWIELQELSTSEENLACRTKGAQGVAGEISRTTTDAEAMISTAKSLSITTGLQLANYLLFTAGSDSERRVELYARLCSTMEAEAVLFFTRTEGGRLSRHEGTKVLLPKEARLLAAAAGPVRQWIAPEVRIKRSGTVLLAGLDRTFLCATFLTETDAREGWKWELLRLAAQFLFGSLKELRVLVRDEICRALAATGGNKAKAAKILGISRTTLDEHLG